MNRWCVRTRPVDAAHSPTLSVTNVNTDSPWIQLKCPGRSRLMANELSTVQYIATTQTRPTQRCARSPRTRRRRLCPPRTMATDAAAAWQTITTSITVLFDITLL